MRGDMQAIDQLKIVPEPAGNAVGHLLALLAGKQLASIAPNGYVNWLYLPWQRKDAGEKFESREAAEQAVRWWVEGLDIVPWDADGRPEYVQDQKTPNDTDTDER